MICSVQLTDHDLIDIASGACHKAGYRMHDDEYRSAVNFAVAITRKKWRAATELSKVSTYCCRVALKLCALAHKRRKSLRRGDEAGAKRGEWMPPVETPIPLPDFELLSFVAAHGKTKAAKLLGMKYYKLQELLQDVELRLRR